VTALFFPKPPSGYVCKIDPETNTYVDEWGTTYRMPPGGYYYDIHEVPLADAESDEDLKRYRWPNPTDPARIAGLPEQIKATYHRGKGRRDVWRHARPLGPLTVSVWV
jgi:uroporphyrinogen decarboxylase